MSVRLRQLRRLGSDDVQYFIKGDNNNVFHGRNSATLSIRKRFYFIYSLQQALLHPTCLQAIKVAFEYQRHTTKLKQVCDMYELVTGAKKDYNTLTSDKQL
jgi:Rps23 Pro-64 3,4-dihydroxylase Tpa1-like proline 4-hydroxylase